MAARFGKSGAAWLVEFRDWDCKVFPDDHPNFILEHNTAVDERRRLSVLDLDGTLLSCDSFLALAMENPRIGTAWRMAMRVLGLMDSDAFAAAMHRSLLGVLSDRAYLEGFAGRMSGRVNQVVLDFARAEGLGGGGETVVVSGSPHEMVSLVSARLGFEGHGSRFEDGGRRHRRLRNMSKLEFVEEFWPRGGWLYDLAVTDSVEECAAFVKSGFGRVFLFKGGRLGEWRGR